MSFAAGDYVTMYFSASCNPHTYHILPFLNKAYMCEKVDRIVLKQEPTRPPEVWAVQ
jgi:hypothetical protein